MQGAQSPYNEKGNEGCALFQKWLREFFGKSLNHSWLVPRPRSEKREFPVQKYLFHGSYTPEGFQGLLAEGGSTRIEAAKQALNSVGGSLEAFYFSFGGEDFYIIVNLPDDVSAMAVTLAGNVSGTFRIQGVALLTPEEMDRAVRMSVDFRPPGH